MSWVAGIAQIGQSLWSQYAEQKEYGGGSDQNSGGGLGGMSMPGMSSGGGGDTQKTRMDYATSASEGTLTGGDWLVTVPQREGTESTLLIVGLIVVVVMVLKYGK